MCQIQELGYIVAIVEFMRTTGAGVSSEMQYQYCILRRSSIAVEILKMQL